MGQPLSICPMDIIEGISSSGPPFLSKSLQHLVEISTYYGHFNGYVQCYNSVGAIAGKISNYPWQDQHYASSFGNWNHGDLLSNFANTLHYLSCTEPVLFSRAAFRFVLVVMGNSHQLVDGHTLTALVSIPLSTSVHSGRDSFQQSSTKTTLVYQDVNQTLY